jgi:DNA polymerase-3 subunit alpha
MVERAVKFGQPGLALTDHGNMSGAVQLYKAGKKHGIQVFPGLEAYLVDDTADKSAQRYHVGLLSLNEPGYQALVALTSRSHQRERFHRFPRIDLADLAQLSEDASEDVALLTGCFFGFVQQTLVNQGVKEAKRIIEMYSRWFPNTYVEIQNHKIDHREQANYAEGAPATDEELCEVLVDLADEIGLPVIASQDAHYLETREKKAHDLLKRMAYRSSEDSTFPGDSFHLSSSRWVREHHEPEHWSKALEGSADLLSKWDLHIGPLDTYKPQIPSTTKTPLAQITAECEARLTKINKDGGLDKPLAAYRSRLKHELSIIGDLGYAGYFTLVTTYVKWCEKKRIAIEARGSGNGSLVCFLLGITQVDPLKYGLLFERFMSRDRKKPPDIDMDIEDERRGELIEFLRSEFDVKQIGTYSALGAKELDDKGSVLVSYISYIRNKLGDDYQREFPGGIATISDVQSYNYDDYKALRALSKTKVRKSYGVHAGGMLLSGDHQLIEDYVPLMLVASSNTMVTQFTMDDVEELGYTKLDILGQKTLTIMRRAQENIGRENPRDFSWIPLEDPATLKYLRADTEYRGIFQFEGYSTARGVQQLKIRSVDDCVIAGALFRPACMDSGMTDLYLSRRFDPKWSKRVDYPHPVFAKVLKPTLGVVLFQEQVLEIMRGLGLDFEGINTFFKIVKDSGKGATDRNRDRAAEVRKTWQSICESNDIEDPDDAWHYIEGYTSYGFNKAHSAGYGLRTYRCAYLKTHYPREFMAAVLASWAGSSVKGKEESFIKETRRLGIKLLPPDVNVSGAVWTMDGKRGIRRGLKSIKGIGESLAGTIEMMKPYKSVEDLIEKTTMPRMISGGKDYLAKKQFTGALKALYESGALGTIGHPYEGDEA